MPVYKFKVMMEEDEDVQRVIEVRPSQTFHELKEVLLKSIDFDNKHDASFFVSDDLWRHGREVAAHERTDRDGNRLPLMEKTKISTFVNDPHQKFVFVYDLAVAWSFLIELTGISRDETAGAEYPRVIKSVGKAPKQYRAIQKVGSELDDDEFAYLTTKLLAKEDVAESVELVGEEDMAGIEGEEGEESEVETDENDELGNDSDDAAVEFPEDENDI